MGSDDDSKIVLGDNRTGAQIDHAMKVVIPESRAILGVVSEVLGVEKDHLRIVAHYPTEVHSRALDDALHGKKVFRERRADAFYGTVISKDGHEIEGPMLHMEAQSTPSHGMFLRAVHSNTAFRERYPHIVEGHEILNVLLLTGKGHPRSLTDNHRQCIEQRTRMVVIDLDQMTNAEFDMSLPGDVVIRLSRSDVTGLNDFLEAFEKAGQVQEESRMIQLQTSVIVIGAVKSKEIYDALVELDMDPRVKENIAHMVRNIAPAIRAEAFADGKAEGKADGIRLMLCDFAELNGAPETVIETIRNTAEEELHAVKNQVNEAILSGDWSEIEAKAGRRLG